MSPFFHHTWSFGVFSDKSADNIGNQCGGWTVRWQGQSGNVTPGGTTILEAIKGAVSKNIQLTYSLDGTGAEGAAIGIVVVGERPYAEGVGDRSDLSLDKEDLAAIANVKKAGIPVLVIMIGLWSPASPGDSLSLSLFYATELENSGRKLLRRCEQFCQPERVS